MQCGARACALKSRTGTWAGKGKYACTVHMGAGGHIDSRAACMHMPSQGRHEHSICAHARACSRQRDRARVLYITLWLLLLVVGRRRLPFVVGEAHHGKSSAASRQRLHSRGVVRFMGEHASTNRCNLNMSAEPPCPHSRGARCCSHRRCGDRRHSANVEAARMW